MLCAIYCRLSKEDEDKQIESESIQNQKSMLVKYAVEREWDIYSLYCDESVILGPSQEVLAAQGFTGMVQFLCLYSTTGFDREDVKHG